MNNNLRDHDVKEKMKEDNFRLFKFRVDGSSKVIKTKALKSLTLPFPAGWSRQFFSRVPDPLKVSDTVKFHHHPSGDEASNSSGYPTAVFFIVPGDYPWCLVIIFASKLKSHS